MEAMGEAADDGEWVMPFIESIRMAHQELIDGGHRVPVTVLDYERWDELEEWCKANLPWHDWVSGPCDPRFPAFFAFRDHGDAFVFKLLACR